MPKPKSHCNSLSNSSVSLRPNSFEFYQLSVSFLDSEKMQSDKKTFSYLNETVVYQIPINKPLECHEKARDDNRSWQNLGVFRNDDVLKLDERTSEEENANRAAE